MMRNRDALGAWRRSWAVGTTLLVGLVAATQVLAVDPPVNRKMTRQIEVMEQIIDQVLIDSPNFLVSGRDNARGLYIESFGVLFTFDASLVDRDFDFMDKWDWGGGFRVKEENGTVIIIPKDEEEWDEEDLDEIKEQVRNSRERRSGREEKLYKRGKTEFVDVLLDYGDTLTTLNRDQWVAIVAYLADDYFQENRFSRLILKAKIGDLRDYASEKLSEEEMVKRIVEEEY